jgi:hypothetical protein
VADYSFDPVAPFPVVRITCEASASEFAGGQLFNLRGFARNFGTGTVAPLTPIGGSLTLAPWDARNKTFTFTLPAAITGVAAAGGLVEIRGILRIGAPTAGADIDFGSHEFVWTF